MRMKRLWLILLIGVCVLLSSATGYNAIYEFDDNEDVIITTTVYNTSIKPCFVCTCNLTIKKPYPLNNETFQTILMTNQGNGVYTINLEKNLSYNDNIYPIVTVCNDTAGFLGGETREGIKIGETLFDYTSLIMILCGIGAILIFSSFRVSNEHRYIQMFTYFAGFAFLIGATFTGLEIVKHSPDAANFIIIFDTMFWAMCMTFLIIMYLRFRDLMSKNLKSTQTKS